MAAKVEEKEAPNVAFVEQNEKEKPIEKKEDVENIQNNKVDSPNAAEQKQNAPKVYEVPSLNSLKAVEKATRIIEQAKQPFWGELIKMFYISGYDISQIEEAFKMANQSFKWKGQISIWYQDSRPTCSEQLQFANGDGRPTYVKKVIKELIEDNAKKAPPNKQVQQLLR